MFYALTQEGVVFKNIIEILHNVFKTLPVQLSNDGLRSKVVDQSGQIMCDLFIPSIKFTEFKLSEPIFFHLNIMTFYDLISSVKKKDNLKLEIRDEEPNSIYLSIISKDSPSRELIDFAIQRNIQVVNVQDINAQYGHPVHGYYPKFAKMCKDLNKISKEVHIKANSSSISFRAKLEGMHSREIIYGELNDEPLEIDNDFKIEHFLKISKISNFGDHMYFFFRKGHPLKIQSEGVLGTLVIYIKYT